MRVVFSDETVLSSTTLNSGKLDNLHSLNSINIKNITRVESSLAVYFTSLDLLKMFEACEIGEII